MGTYLNLPEIPENERTPLVDVLLAIISKQSEQIAALSETLQLAREEIQCLKDEIAILKGNKPKPKIPKSKLEDPKNKGKKKEKGKKGKRPGSAKRSKTKDLEIHETVNLIPTGVCSDWFFKGYKDYVVQGLRIESHNVKYRRGHWCTSDGKSVIAELPSNVCGHFDPVLISYIQHQYFSCRVTQPLISEQLREFGIEISSGQLNEILTENNDIFHKEKEDILRVGLGVSSYIQTDDTGARNKGKNGYSNCISNEFFTYFKSTDSKSRINFLEILRAGHTDYIINNEALSYMKESALSQAVISKLEQAEKKFFKTYDEWNKHLDDLEIKLSQHLKTTTEAALLGSAFNHGLSNNLVVLSDDAGQFNILTHALCWIHAERTINKLIGYNDNQREALNIVRDQIWQIYKKLKIFKEDPSEGLKSEIEENFEEIFTQKTCYQTLNLALSRLHKNKAELLRVLDYPFVPLHNNACETDVREIVTKRKVSGGTQSALGRLARDSFLSLKKTCRKLGITFWGYLKDRNSTDNNIPRLSQIILERANVTL